MKDGIRCETVRTSRHQGITNSGFRYDGLYRGRIAVYEHGKRLWSQLSGVERISRGDALIDAQRLVNSLSIHLFCKNGYTHEGAYALKHEWI